MTANVGDRIVVESERVGQADREGEILEVIPGVGSPHYVVRWDDGHESDIRPAAGSARIVPKAASKPRARRSAPARPVQRPGASPSR